MKKFSNEDLSTIWSKGVPMSQSWLAYAGPELKSDWEAAHEESAITAFERAAKNPGFENAIPAEKVSILFQKPGQILTKRAEIRTKLQSRTMSFVQRDLLIAYGFEPPRKLASVPVRIPKSVWHRELDWDSSKLSGNGLEFLEVRLITPEAQMHCLSDRRAKSENLANQPGRPSFTPHIEEAIIALAKDGKIDPKKSATSHYEMIREYMREAHPEIFLTSVKIGDEVIRRSFSIFFKEFRKSHKL